MKKNFNDLLETVAKLRGPDGCPWDKKQTLYSLKDDLIEEVYELISALDKKDMPNICEELGDVLLHVAMHTRIAEEDGFFDIDDVTDNIVKKLIRRHPHVFSETEITSDLEVLKQWETIKAQEKGDQHISHTLDKADKSFPTLPKSEKLQKTAAEVGFDWKTAEDVMLKVAEEYDELRDACNSGDFNMIKEEMGDLLFVLVNLSRHYGFSADEALRAANVKFVKRFNYIEDTLSERGEKLTDSNLETMEKLWLEAKWKQW
ncbi:MAG: nucleoside triphosphate pyrophosphohydrolase [Deferribacteraceae bacterium]|nr:nucleoside triphosphate pyrophosphohydrolase [Deferribacteraceae bacterium]